MSSIDRLRGYLLDGEPIRFSLEEMNRLLVHAKSVQASDIYFKTGRPVVARVHGRLVRLTQRKLEHAEVVTVTCDLYGGANAELQLRSGKPLDNAYSVKVGRGESLRFRWCATGVLVNSNFGIEIVLRELASVPPKLDRSQVDPRLLAGLFPADGLVFVCGETGAGKSTFLASVVRERAEDPEADAHIVTFEAPIEYTYDKIETVSCEIDQSAVPDHLGSFAEGIRNSLRRDPDVILIGESRDAETIKAGVLAGQTGHLVYTTLHANSAATAFLRLIQALPPEEAHSILGSIIDAVRVIVCQKLINSTDGKRVPVREFIVFDSAMRRELLSVATRNISMLPLRAGEMVEEYGVSMLRHAEQLLAEGKIESHYVELIRADKEAERARSKDIADGR